MSGSNTSPSHQAVAALAVVKANWDDDKDYISNFIPVVAHCLRRSEVDPISLAEIQDQIKKAFGLEIPQGALKTILRRMSREGLVRLSHGVYQRVEEAVESINLDPARETALRQHAALVSRLQDYANSLGREWSQDQADRALTAYIESLAEPILGAVLEGEPIVDLPDVGSEGSAVVSRFVLHVCKQEPEAFEYLETVVKGSMLANVLYLPDAFSSGSAHLANVDVYLDTPVVLRGLGYSEDEYRVPAQELIALLRTQGASLCVFEHTYDEVLGVLDGAAAQYRSGSRAGSVPGDVVDFFTSEGMSRSDVQLAIAELDSRLHNAGIKVVPSPEHGEDESVEEADLEAALADGVGYGRRETLVKDLDSLTAIHRLRGGRIRRDVEHCNALFVTTNTALARVARTYFSNIYGALGVPVCMVDAALAALAWLMNPTQAPDLPRRQIIATSYAALNPTEGVWRRYLDEIRSLQEMGQLTDSQVSLLLYSRDARLELMTFTEGNAEVYTEGTAAQVLAYAESTARAEVESKLQREREQRASAEERVEEEKKGKHDALKQLDGVQAAHDRHLQRIAHQVANVGSWCVFTVGVTIVIAGTMAASSPLFPPSWSRAIPLGSVLVVVLALIGVASLVCGWTVMELQRWASRKMERRASELLRRWFTP